MSDEITCPNCHAEFAPERHIRLRWVAAAAGAVIGGAATESLLGGAIIGGLTYGLAAAFDEYQARRCPDCDTIAFEPRQKPFGTTAPEAPPPAQSAH